MGSSYAKLANMPVEEEAPKGASRILDMPDDDQVEEERPWWKRAASDLTNPNAWKHALGIVARGAIEGVESPIVVPADFGIAVRNALTGSDYESLSSMRDKDLDSLGLPRPKSALEKVNSFAASVLGGSFTPVPSIKNPAPPNFVPPAASPSAAILQRGREAGLVVPPATANPSMVNKMLEGYAGKISTAQAASEKNQEVFNAIAKKALGIPEKESLTPEILKEIRDAAGKVYEQIGKSGEIVPDAQYLDDLAKLGQGADEIAKAFPGANVGASKQVSEMVDSLLQEKFDAGAALQYLKELRKMSRGNLSGMNAADPAKQALGMAQKEAAATLEDMIGRHLERIGEPEVAQAFSGARKTIAMAHTVEDALNESTGNIVAGKLGKQLAKGKPLSNGLDLIANFAQAFPKASKEIVESMPGVSPLDYAGATFAAVATDTPGMLATIAGRPAVRKMLLSPLWQKAAPATPINVPWRLGVGPSAVLQAGQKLEDQE